MRQYGISNRTSYTPFPAWVRLESTYPIMFLWPLKLLWKHKQGSIKDIWRKCNHTTVTVSTSQYSVCVCVCVCTHWKFEFWLSKLVTEIPMISIDNREDITHWHNTTQKLAIQYLASKLEGKYIKPCHSTYAFTYYANNVIYRCSPLQEFQIMQYLNYTILKSKQKLQYSIKATNEHWSFPYRTQSKAGWREQKNAVGP